MLYMILLLSLVMVFFIRLSLIWLSWQTVKTLFGTMRNTDPRITPPIPSVSVLIPARNEQRNIRPCLDSLLQQALPPREIIVLDDGSTDKTSEIVRQMQQKNGKIKLVKNRHLPAGWTGKNYALHRAVQESKGEYLLFVDADVRLSPECLAHTMSHARDSDADLVTMFPAVRCAGFWEKVILPVWGEILFLPMKRTMGPDPKRAMAFGGYLLFKRATYDRIGGHERVKGEIIEDVALARIVKQEGYKLTLLAGWPNLLTARMYVSLRHIWEGIGKTISGMKVWQLLLGCCLPLVMFVLPWLSVPMALADQWLSGWNRLNVSILLLGSCLITMALLIRRFLAKLADIDNTYPYLQPLGGLMVAAMFAHSITKKMLRKGPKWKGRTYR